VFQLSCGKTGDAGFVSGDDLIGLNTMSFELIFEVGVTSVFFSSHLFDLCLKRDSCGFVIVVHLSPSSFELFSHSLSGSVQLICQIHSNILSVGRQLSSNLLLLRL